MDSIELAFAGAAEQARLLASGAVTAPALTDLYLDRIARLDPELRSYRVVFAEQARRAAAEAQERLDAGSACRFSVCRSPSGRLRRRRYAHHLRQHRARACTHQGR